MAGRHLGEDGDDDVEVAVGIETGRSLWVAVLAAGYTVFGVNPRQASRVPGAPLLTRSTPRPSRR